jgi:methyl-accepting chemotaxis protein
MVIAFIAFAGVAGLLLSLLISRSIAGGLSRVAGRANLVADGDLTAEDIPVRGRDEIALLSTAFNQMKNNLKKAINQLSGFSNTLYEEATRLSGQAQHTSSGACENASTVGEMAATLENAALSAQNISSVAGEAAQKAKEGARGLERINSQMDSIISTTNMTAQVITSLSGTIGRVSRIVEMITGIAEQTNLLALNAAIESARAGEQGRGFAVVADEVRKLAEQTTDAAKEISRLMINIGKESKESVEAMARSSVQVEDSVKVVNDVGNIFTQIINIVDDMARQVRSLAAATGDISAGIQSVAQTTEGQTAAMEEVSAATQELNRMSANIDQLVKNFKI